MKAPEFENIDPGVRAVILITVAIAYPAWNFGFEIGAYGRLFYEKVFVTWSISTALLIILLMMPREHLQVPRVVWFATALPSLWLIFAMAARAAPDEPLFTHALTIMGFIAYLACFPYVIYMSISIAYPDLLRIKRMRGRVGITAMIAALFIFGYVVGVNHPHLLTCEDFLIAGNHVPENCTAADPGPGL